MKKQERGPLSVPPECALRSVSFLGWRDPHSEGLNPSSSHGKGKKFVFLILCVVW